MSIVSITTTDSFIEEKRYIFDVLFKDFLGVDYELLTKDNIDHYEIAINTIDIRKTLIVTDVFFSSSKDCWLNEKSLPNLPLQKCDLNNVSINPTLVKTIIPVIYGSQLVNGSYGNFQDNNTVKLGIDIFGSCFFMLTRYEETVIKEKDDHGRFDTKHSVAWKEKFIDRPIVNEYLEILWASIQFLDKNIERKKRKFDFKISHDVDKPFLYYNQKYYTFFRRTLSKWWHNQIDTLTFSNSIVKFLIVKILGYKNDPYYVFDWIMNECENVSTKTTFNFITDSHDIDIDCDYSIMDKRMRKLLKRINQREHCIGLHPSYYTMNNFEKTKNEFNNLVSACKLENIDQNEWPSRQHYLRFDLPEMWQRLNDTGLSTDSSLSFADMAGFRCGTCYPYHTFNLLTKQKLKLIEVPLIVMEWSVLAEKYMNIKNSDEAYLTINSLIKKCYQFSGCFTLLWHNHLLDNEDRKNLFIKILRDSSSLKNYK